jgi:predicted ATPase
VQQQAPGLRVLVASRERLRLRGEEVLTLDGLAYPTPLLADARNEMLPLTDYAAVQLLLHHIGHERSSATIESFSAPNQHAIGQICHMVQGLPLALELVAPWLVLRSPQEIVHTLSTTTDILQSNAPDRAAGHRSIHTVFAYSWHLLPEAEAHALARLGVFPASFTADAADVIAAASLAILAALHDASLIQVLQGEPETRYALHPLLQRYALTQLQTDPPAEAATRRYHAQYYATFAQAHEQLLTGLHSPTAILALKREFDNLRAGWQWAVTHQDILTLGQYSIALHDFCALRAWRLESHRLFEEGAAVARSWLHRAAPDSTVLAAVRVLSCYAELQQTLGNTAVAAQAYQDCRLMLHTIAMEDAPSLWFVYKQLGVLAYGQGAYSEAGQYLRHALAIAEDADDVVRVADTLLAIGALAIAEGAWDTAEQALRRGLDIYTKVHYDWGRSHTLRFLGILARIHNMLAPAYGYLHTSLVIAQQLNNRVGEALALDQLGILHMAEGQFDQAAAVLDQALELFQHLGVALGVGRVLSHLGELARVQNQRHQACRYLEQASAIAEDIQALPLLIECAAIGLHVLRNGSDADHALLPLMSALEQHAACPAETRRQLAALATAIASEQDRAQQAQQGLSLEATIAVVRARLTDVGIMRVRNGDDESSSIGGTYGFDPSDSEAH